MSNIKKESINTQVQKLSLSHSGVNLSINNGKIMIDLGILSLENSHLTIDDVKVSVEKSTEPFVALVKYMEARLKFKYIDRLKKGSSSPDPGQPNQESVNEDKKGSNDGGGV